MDEYFYFDPTSAEEEQVIDIDQKQQSTYEKLDFLFQSVFDANTHTLAKVKF